MKLRIISPFLVSKCLTETIGSGYKATKLASGDLLLEVRDKAQYEKLNNLVAFGDIPIIVTAHRTMNTVKGVISEEGLVNLSDEELLERSKDDNVNNVQRIKIRRDNKEIPTKHLVITSGFTTSPEKLETGCIKI